MIMRSIWGVNRKLHLSFFTIPERHTVNDNRCLADGV
jgi:hypothetical protein